MKNSLLFCCLALIIVCCSRKKERKEPALLVSDFIASQIDSMETNVNSLEALAENKESGDLQKEFLKARLAYKQIESLTEFYFAGISKAINGPAIDKPEEHDDKVILATGFQVVEEYLYPSIDDSRRTEMLNEIKTLKSCVVRMRALTQNNQFTDPNIFQAVRLGILRIMSLGISGFDSPVALLSLTEAQASLEGYKHIMSFYNYKVDEQQWQSLAKSFDQAIEFLRNNSDFDFFDRAEFITSYLNPLSEEIYNYQVLLGIPNNKWIEAVNMDTKDFFQANVFNVDFFAPADNKNDKQVAELGKVLFFDPVLSGNSKRSCSSCHQPEKAFTDGRSKSLAFNFEGEIQRNAPTLINAGFQKSQFWDQRVHFIEDQVIDVVNNPLEMHGRLDEAAYRLKKSDEYISLFTTAFHDSVNAITEMKIRKALATYIRSLQAMNSRFDAYMRDQSVSLNEEELEGFNLFMGKAKCGTCHFLPLFNGSVPPLYGETESEVLGIPDHPDTTSAEVDSDLGKFHTYKRDLHKNAFKTPTIRNAALTAPYMHNGVYNSLEEVMDFYNRGGGEGIGISLPNQTLPTDKLNLSNEEQKKIIVFINTLTDTTNISRRPAHLPKFADYKLNDRIVGGEY